MRLFWAPKGVLGITYSQASGNRRSSLLFTSLQWLALTTLGAAAVTTRAEHLWCDRNINQAIEHAKIMADDNDISPPLLLSAPSWLLLVCHPTHLSFALRANVNVARL